MKKGGCGVRWEREGGQETVGLCIWRTAVRLLLLLGVLSQASVLSQVRAASHHRKLEGKQALGLWSHEWKI